MTVRRATSARHCLHRRQPTIAEPLMRAAAKAKIRQSLLISAHVEPTTGESPVMTSQTAARLAEGRPARGAGSSSDTSQPHTMPATVWVCTGRSNSRDRGETWIWV